MPFLVARFKAYKKLISMGVSAQAPAPGPVAELNSKVLLPRFFSEFAEFYKNVNRLKLQRCITSTVESIIHAADWQAASKRDQMRLLDLQGPGASAAVCAIPNNPATSRTDLEWVLSNRDRYGMVLDPTCTHCGACGHAFTCPEEQSTHFHSCIKYRKTTVNDRHDGIGKHTCTIGRHAGLHTTWEKRPDSGSRMRPDGGFHLSDGTLLTDTTCRHPVTNTAMRIVNFKPGKVLDDACKGKITDYKTFAERAGASFLPLAISVYGRFHKDYLIFLKKLSWEAINNGVLSDDKERIAFYRQSVAEISVLRAKYNARILIRGLQDSRSRRWELAHRD